MSGLFFGSVTSLFFVPLFYVWLDDLNIWRQRIKLFSRREPRRSAGARAEFSAAGPCRRPSSRRRARSRPARRRSRPAAVTPVAARSRWHSARSRPRAILSPRFLISAASPSCALTMRKRLRDFPQPRKAGFETAVLGALDAAVVGEPRVHREAGDGEPREQVLRIGDHREVDEPAALDREAREFRPGLLLDRAVRLAHVGQLALGARTQRSRCARISAASSRRLK